MKRPMLYWVISFVLGEVLAGRIPKSGMVLMSLVILIVICKVKQTYIEKNKRLLFFGVLFFLWGFLSFTLWDNKISICEYNNKCSLTFRGKIIERTQKGSSYIYILRCNEISGRNINAKIIIDTDHVMLLGSTVKGRGVYKEFLTASNPGQFDEKDYNFSKGILVKITDISFEYVKKPVLGLREGLDVLHKKALEIMQDYIDDRYYSVAQAMLLGEKSEMDKELKELYQRNGIAHILAISGLHIAMLGGTFYHFIRRVTGNFVVAALIGAIFIVSYGIMTGLSTATIRAVIMLILTIGADVLGRKYDAMTGLAVALLIMIITNPLQMKQAGFLLSFGAVAGITCVYPVINNVVNEVIPKGNSSKINQKKRTIIRSFPVKGMEGLLISISVQLVTVPILLFYFYEIPLYSFFLNIIVVPLMSILLGCLITVEISGILSEVMINNSFFSLIFFGKGFTVTAKITAKLSEYILGIYEKLCVLADGLPFHTICTGRPKLSWIIMYYILLFICLLLLYLKRYFYGTAAFTLICILCGSFFLPGPLRICMFDVGQGDGIYLRMPNGISMLIDGGSISKKKIGSYILKNGIKYYGSDHLMYCIVTHTDRDHYSGVLELMDCRDIQIDNIVLPYILNPDKTYIEICRIAENKGCNIIFIKAGDKIVLGDVTFVCINPKKRMYEDKNSGSIVLWMKYNKFDMLFTGDVDCDVEKEIISNQILVKELNENTDFEVLKVAHHGSKTSSSKEFLESFNFNDAIISVGDSNAYGHPSPEVVDRLTRYCRRIYLTKESGAITIETDGKIYDIKEFK